MEKYLITGFSGFVSKHFLTYLNNKKVAVVVLGIDINQYKFETNAFKYIQFSFEQADLLDKNLLENIIYKFQPNYILHLASYSSVAFSWRMPVESFSNNTNIFLSLLEIIRKFNLKCRILSVGSSEEYGNVNEADLPLRENHSLNPVSPYAVARVSQEMLSKVYVDGFGLDIVMTRSFNHIGPGQSDLFVVSSFAKQLVVMAKIGADGELITGNIEIIRDFVDVRDVVHAYYLLLKNGKSGEVYNICGGQGISLKEVIYKMARIVNLKVTNRMNEELMRPNENRIVIGSSEKINVDLGWERKISLEQSLKDIITYWEKSI